jgi:hypothetical protein
LSSPRSWFRIPFVYRPRAERRVSPALAAFHWDGSNPRQIFVANISSSGAYLLTKERWNIGEILSLTLQRSGMLESANQRRCTVRAKAIRQDREGIGVTFLMPQRADVRLWQSTLKADVPQTEPEDVVREFRLASATAFIHRIAPEAVEQARLLMRRGLSNYRLESALEIVQHAEELLALESDGAGMRADPSVVLRILEDGSWAETDWIQHYWAGLLATSCICGEVVKPDLKFVSLLSQITTIQARIFAGSCSLAAESAGHSGRDPREPLTCSAQELIQLADTHDRVHIERDILHLVGLGLIEKSAKWKFFSLLDQAVITPTKLALDLYARCHGYRGDGAGVLASPGMAPACVAAD